jgi:hypothetical protein
MSGKCFHCRIEYFFLGHIVFLSVRLSQSKLICEFSIGKCLENVFIAELYISFWAILSSSQSEYLGSLGKYLYRL